MSEGELTLYDWRNRSTLYQGLVVSMLRAFGDGRTVTHYDTHEILRDVEGYAKELLRLRNDVRQRAESPTRREIDRMLDEVGVPRALEGETLSVAERLARCIADLTHGHAPRKSPPTASEVHALVRLWEGASFVTDLGGEVPVLVYQNVRTHGVGVLCSVAFVHIVQGSRVCASDRSAVALDHDDVTGFVFLGPDGPVSERTLAELVAAQSPPHTPAPSRDPVDELVGACQRLDEARSKLRAEGGVEWYVTSTRDLRGHGWGVHMGTVLLFVGASVRGEARPGAVAKVRDATIFYDRNTGCVTAFTTALRDDREAAARSDAKERETTARYEARDRAAAALAERAPPATPRETCHADSDGDCDWAMCPQNHDGEPDASGRQCPLGRRAEEGGIT